MLLNKSNALASVAFLSLFFAGLGPVGSDPVDLQTVLAKLTSAPSASQAPSTLSLSAPAPVTASQAAVRQFYPTLQAGASTSAGAPGAAPVTAASPGQNPFAALPAPSAAADAASNPFLAPPAAVNAPATSEPSAPFALETVAATKTPGATADAPAAIDDTALRYYADQRNLERVGAEIRRLKASYPDWAPPADLFAPKSTVDEQPVWDLFAAGRYADARRMIAELSKQTPSYRPSADLAAKLDSGEARAAIDEDARTQDWSGVVAAAQKAPTILTCDNIDILWNVGEAFSKTGDLARSFDLYSYILANCQEPEQRLATVQKAALVLPPQGLDALVTHGRTLPDGSGEFDAMRFEPLRAEIGEVIDGKRVEVTLRPEDLQAFRTFAKRARSAPDAALLGWLDYSRNRFDQAVEWFALASSIDPNPKNLEGTVLSLRNRGDTELARQIAWQDHEQSPELTKIYIELVADALDDSDGEKGRGGSVDAAEMRRFEALVDEARSSLGAQTLGWSYVDDDKISTASDWFAKSVKWEPSEEGVVGLAVVASREKDNAELKTIKAKWGDRYAALDEFEEYRPPAVSSVKRSVARSKSAKTRSAGAPHASRKRRAGRGGDKSMQQAQALFDSGQYEQALSVLEKRKGRSAGNDGSEILKGWANIKLKRWDTAERIFREQDKRRSTKDTRFGIGAVQNSKYKQWSESRNGCTTRWKC